MISLSALKIKFDQIASFPVYLQTILSYSLKIWIKITSVGILWFTVINIVLEYPQFVELNINSHPNVTCALLTVDPLFAVVILMALVFLVMQVYKACNSQHFLDLNHEKAFFWIMCLFSIIAVLQYVGKIFFYKGFCFERKISILRKKGINLDKEKFPPYSGKLYPPVQIINMILCILTKVLLIICERRQNKLESQRAMQANSREINFPIIPRVSEHNQRVLTGGLLLNTNSSFKDSQTARLDEDNHQQVNELSNNDNEPNPSMSKELSVKQILHDFSSTGSEQIRVNKIQPKPVKKIKYSIQTNDSLSSSSDIDQISVVSNITTKSVQNDEYKKSTRLGAQLNPSIFITSEEYADALFLGDDIKRTNTLSTRDIIQVQEANPTVNSRSNIQQLRGGLQSSANSSIGSYVTRRNSLTVERGGDSDDTEVERVPSVDDENTQKQKLSFWIKLPLTTLLLSILPAIVFAVVGQGKLVDVVSELVMYIIPVKATFDSDEVCMFAERKIKNIFK